MSQENAKNKSFIGYLNTLRRNAESNPIYGKFKKYKQYYEGDVAPTIPGTNKSNNYNFYNAIKPIIETKATISLDAQITTSVKPSSLSHANFDQIENIESISDILNDVWENVKIKADLSSLQQKIVRDGLIYGIGIAKASWDSTKEDGLGNVALTRISPQDFFPEPQATSIENSNYIFVRRIVSKFDLINQYKGNKKVINMISKMGESSDTDNNNSSRASNTVATFTNDQKGGQAYLEESSFLGVGSKQNLEIWECYLKDDTVFVAQKNDSSNEEQVKKSEIFKYPHGRLIIYSNNQILEDKPLDYPFGFPFQTFQPTQSDGLVGYGDVADLMQIQARLCDAYMKLTTLLNKYKSVIILQKDSIPPGAFEKDFDIIYSNPGPSNPPIVISNKLTQDIQIIRQHIEDLKKDALKISRINEIMLSGERPVGVNSGQMVQDLIESPMSAIREIQRNFKQFLVGLSSKSISLIQLYYNQPRILRLSGDRFAAINISPDGENSIDVMDKNRNPIEQILGDFTLTEYEVEIQTGSAMPQSQQALAAVTMQLARDGIFGDINNVDVKELILQTLDYPHYRAIIGKIKEEQEKMEQLPPQEPQFEDYLKNLTMSLKDVMGLVDTLDPNTQFTAKAQITEALGLSAPVPLAPEEPIEENLEEVSEDEQLMVQDTSPGGYQGDEVNVDDSATFVDFSQ